VAAANENHHAALSLRLAARPAQAALLRAHLRLWLTERQAAEDEILEILLAVNEAFGHAITRSHETRSIAVHVDARLRAGVVDIRVRDYGRWQENGFRVGAAPPALEVMQAFMDAVDLQIGDEGTTIRLRRTLGPRLIRVEQASLPAISGRVELLARSPIFEPLSADTRARLAARLIPISVSTEQTIIREGDAGELVYLIAGGRLRVSADGRKVATLGPGDHVGEIALLHDVPRTATVTVKKPVKLYALPREDFLSAVTSHQLCTRTAESVIAARLSGLEAAVGRVAAPPA
jgi:anti-sigma regulatory factor (Ser/Thr protein kinase)